MLVPGSQREGPIRHFNDLGQNAPGAYFIRRLPRFAEIIRMGAIQGRDDLVTARAQYHAEMPGLNLNAVRLTVALGVDVRNGICLHIGNG